MKEFLKGADDELQKHMAAIDRISSSMNIPRDEVEQLYQRELAEIQQKATIKTFAAILAARRVEQILKRMAGVTLKNRL